MTNDNSKIDVINSRLNKKFPYFSKIVDKRLYDFGPSWAEDFEIELEQFFGDNRGALEKAVDGYGEFALDAMKLQKRFDKDGEYIFKNYADVAKQIYHSSSYMYDLYLPGILLSQFLWRHHYQQLLYFREKFVPLALKLPVKLFYDVGVGTGFYSKEMLKRVCGSRGEGFDISEHSLAHTNIMLQKVGLNTNYTFNRINILEHSNQEQADAIISVEVLEHLEDPISFLKGLFGMLRVGGIGYITAAINAPNADHIYLYRNLIEVSSQIQGVGFEILDSSEYFGYEPRNNESVPSGGVFIVRK